MERYRRITASMVAFCLGAVLLPIAAASASEMPSENGPLAGRAAPLAAEGERAAFLQWSDDRRVSLLPEARLPARMSHDQARMGVDSLNEHLAAGHVTVSPTFEVRITPEGRAAAIRDTAETFGDCRKVTGVRASWLGIFVDSEDLCTSSGSAPGKGAVGSSGGQPKLVEEGAAAVSPSGDDYFECALTVFGAALSIWAFIKSQEWGEGYWQSILATAVTIYLALRSCYNVWGVLIEKNDGYGYASDYYYNWRYSDTYGWLPGGQDSYGGYSWSWGS